ELVVPGSAAHLMRTRWFGEKGKAIASIGTVDFAIVRLGDDWLALTIVAVSFEDQSDDAWYFVPFAIVAETVPAVSSLLTLPTADGDRRVVDAFALPSFAAWLLGQQVYDYDLPTSRGRFHWNRIADPNDTLRAALCASPRLGSAEQSNTAIVFGERVFLKVFRRLRPGVQPDEEIGRFLAEKTGYRHFPDPLGVMTYIPANGPSYSISLAQRFVPNYGDGWAVTLRSLAGMVARDQNRSECQELLSSQARLMAQLGTRTGEFHLALASGVADPMFQPAFIAAGELDVWDERVRKSVHTTLAALVARRDELSPPVGALIDRFEDQAGELATRISAIRHLEGLAKIRVHGDFHLGQVIRTTDNDWSLLDFEGEPARTIEERRAKTSVLKDLAGMTRSFSYARGAALKSISPDQVTVAISDDLVAWETNAREAFLAAYLSTVRPASVRLVPTEIVAFDAVVRAWEIDKALYEIAYELNNRPTWLDLPLQSLVA
ncbi:MAG: hypothetical protein M3354_02530, partial [Chloroflexota bacterium]|nr:hypothetical protein [Chloroflexota bacterium]